MGEPDPRNVPGEFYVQRDCCLLCGVPWTLAPELFGDDKDGCWVKRQCTTADEHRTMLLVLQTQELGCIQRRQNS